MIKKERPNIFIDNAINNAAFGLPELVYVIGGKAFGKQPTSLTGDLLEHTPDLDSDTYSPESRCFHGKLTGAIGAGAIGFAIGNLPGAAIAFTTSIVASALLNPLSRHIATRGSEN